MIPEPIKEAAGNASSDNGGSPPCFGDPSRVCPKDDDGFIQPQAACVSCKCLRSCLQLALKQAGFISDSSGQNPLISRTTDFFKRWSNKKLAGKHYQEHPT
jgi:hypothetical protein